MPFITTDIPGVLVFEPKVFEDSRGYFYESWNESVFREQRIDIRWVQDNQSSSAYGVIRGLHFQKAPHAQTKLVRVIRGRILDVVVDTRIGSPAFGKIFAVELSGKNRKQVFIPKGLAHGFAVLSKKAEVHYKCDELYHPESESGILYNDPALGIDWQLGEDDAIVSGKDQILPLLKDMDNNTMYVPA